MVAPCKKDDGTVCFSPGMRAEEGGREGKKKENGALEEKRGREALRKTSAHID